MISYYIAKFIKKLKDGLESNKFNKLTEFHFQLINDYSN